MKGEVPRTRARSRRDFAKRSEPASGRVGFKGHNFVGSQIADDHKTVISAEIDRVRMGRPLALVDA